jgi:AraC family transcriptional regulator
MNLVRWAAERGGAYVDSAYFERMTGEPHLYWFATRDLIVPEHGGLFSLKLVLSGLEQYRIGRRSVQVRPGLALLVEAGRRYASAITQQTESLSIFVPCNVVFEAAAAGRARAAEALDFSARARSTPAVDSVPFGCGRALATSIADLRRHVAADDRAAVRAGILLAVSDALARMDSIFTVDALQDLKRRSTREEMLTRVLRARDRILDEDGAFSLETLSATACLSRFHFLRIFRAAFGQTPMHFARRVRLRRAARHVERGDLRRAAHVAGYSNLQAFRRAWRRELQRGGGLNSPGSRAPLS